VIISFNSTLHGLVESIIKEQCLSVETDVCHSSNTAAHCLSEQYVHLPDYLRIPFKCLVLVFDAWALLCTGQLFHCLSHERRWRQIEAWKRSSFGFRRDLIKFFEMITVFAEFLSRVVYAGLTRRPVVPGAHP
jgi:hypothetical protein